MFVGFALYADPSPANPCLPRLPMYARSRVMLLVICRWILTFHVVTEGNTCDVGRMRGCTEPVGPPNGRTPLVGIVGKTYGTGPCARLNAGYKLVEAPAGLFGLLVASRFWLARTGRFWVTACPKFEPNT